MPSITLDAERRIAAPPDQIHNAVVAVLHRAHAVGRRLVDGAPR
ncbi:hypothetical protein [Kitasatospora sp. NPDC058190]